MFRTRRGQGLATAALLGLCATAAGSPVSAPDPLKVGAIFSLTGTYVVTEGPALRAAQIAVKEINERGGIKGRPIELVHYDGRSTEADVVGAAHRLVHEDGVIALVGVFDSAFYQASARIAQEAGIPYISTGGTEPDLPDRIGTFAHMMAFGDDYQAYVAAEFAANDLGATSAFVLHNADWEYTRSLARLFAEGFAAQGGMVVGGSSYRTGETDHSAAIAQMRGIDPPPDVIYAAVNPDEVASVVRQARQGGITQPILGADAFDTPDLVSNEREAQLIEPVYFTTHMAPPREAASGGAASAASSFIEAYKREYGRPPENGFAGLGYDSIYVLAEAMTRARELTPQALNDALFSITDFHGVTGRADFSNRRRAPDKEVALVAVKNGGFALIGYRKPQLAGSAFQVNERNPRTISNDAAKQGAAP